MAILNIVPNGALLIRNGLIEEVGPARRVENLAGARRAREIDATGKLVMPAFVDADMALVVPPPLEPCADGKVRDCSDSLRLMSRKRVQAGAAAMGVEWARYGCLTVGARTNCADDLKNIGKVLRTHQVLQNRPLRIRSIITPTFPEGPSPESVVTKWLTAIRNKRLASVVELSVGDNIDEGAIRATAEAASDLGFAIRLRSDAPLERGQLRLALAAGAMGIVAPLDSLTQFASPLAAVGCVRVIPAAEVFDNAARARQDVRAAIDEGAAIALSSTHRPRGALSANMQFLLFLGVHHLGLTPEEAIVATTWNPASSLRLSHVTGSLEPGKHADLVVMGVSDYRDLPRRAGHHDATLVMRKGKVVFRSSPLISE